MTTKHSDLPWRVGVDDHIFDSHDVIVCRSHRAREIVTLANSHRPLVEAATEALKWLEDVDDGYGDLHQLTLAKLRAALALVKGEQ